MDSFTLRMNSFAGIGDLEKMNLVRRFLGKIDQTPLSIRVARIIDNVGPCVPR
jgi:hypothetical protein